MKRSQTAKYRRRRKKELANRKARQLATQHTQSDDIDEAARDALREPHVSIHVLTKEEAEAEDKPVSPARRAFQDV